MRGTLRVIGLALACASCRIAPAEPYWIEAHGAAQMSHIAASPRGVDGVGTNGDLYHYPGDFGVPWRTLRRGVAARALASSPHATYALDSSGRLQAISGARADFDDALRASAISIDERERVHVVAGDRAFRLQGKDLVPLACDGPAVALSASSAGVYVLSPIGAVSLATEGSCVPVETPGPVTSVAAFGDRLAVVVGHSAYRKTSLGWRKLPLPIIYRGTGPSPTRVADVAITGTTLWARGERGEVFVLWEPDVS